MSLLLLRGEEKRPPAVSGPLLAACRRRETRLLVVARGRQLLVSGAVRERSERRGKRRKGAMGFE